MTAIQILSEIGGDMSVFPTAKHLVSWAGCCPRNDQSNKKSNQFEFPMLVTILNQYWYKLQMVYCVLRNILKQLTAINILNRTVVTRKPSLQSVVCSCHELGVVSIFTFLKPPHDGLFAIPFSFSLPTTSLFQAFYPPRK